MDLYSKDADRVSGCVPSSPSHPARPDASPSYSEDFYLRPSDVKRRFALSKRCVRKAIKRGDLPTVVVCGKVRIPASLMHLKISRVDNSVPQQHQSIDRPLPRTLTGAGYDDTWCGLPPTPSGLVTYAARLGYNLVAAGMPADFDLISDDPDGLELNWSTPGSEGYTHAIAEELSDILSEVAAIVAARSNGRS